MKRKVICILMSSILSLSSAQVQTIFAEEMTITDGLSESENSDVIENENLQIEDQTETVDADNETIPDCIENQEVEVLQKDSEFSDGASENTEGLKEFSENNTRVTQSEYNGFLYDIMAMLKMDLLFQTQFRIIRLLRLEIQHSQEKILREN